MFQFYVLHAVLYIFLFPHISREIWYMLCYYIFHAICYTFFIATCFTYILRVIVTTCSHAILFMLLPFLSGQDADEVVLIADDADTRWVHLLHPSSTNWTYYKLRLLYMVSTCLNFTKLFSSSKLASNATRHVRSRSVLRLESVCDFVIDEIINIILVWKLI